MTTRLSQDRLIRKEVSLGVIREFEPPQGHIGTTLLAPYKNVESDDVIFDYTRGITQAGLAPARAEDAESELAQKDDSVGTGRASIIDWALKDHYDPSDVSRYREALIYGGIAGASSLPLTIDRLKDGFEEKIARDTRLRRRKLDNRIEWLITQALETNGITYNDGKIKFTVTYGRPGGQSTTAGTLWSNTASDPIGDLLTIQNTMFNTYGTTMTRAIISRRVLTNILNSTKFTNSLIGSNPLYTVRDWGYDTAKEVVSRATGIDFIVYDSVYRTRPIGSNTITNTRFLSDNKVYMLPSTQDLDALDDAIGFGATLTSPHPEGNWTSGFYEWEKDTGPDPWGHDIGTGIKMFPVFPHMELSWVLTVL